MAKRNHGGDGRPNGLSHEADPNQAKTGAASNTVKSSPPLPDKRSKKVRVIVPEGTTLGPKLLVNGDVTDDPDYVALLDIDGRAKVEAV